MFIFIESNHKRLMQRLERVNQFQDKYDKPLLLSQLKQKTLTYVLAYEKFNRATMTFFGGVMSNFDFSGNLDVNRELLKASEELDQELDVVGWEIVSCKSAIQCNRDIYSSLSDSDYKIISTLARHTNKMDNIRISPDNTIYIKNEDENKIPKTVSQNVPSVFLSNVVNSYNANSIFKPPQDQELRSIEDSNKTKEAEKIIDKDLRLGK